MEKLNEVLRDKTEGFHPSLFSMDYPWQGLGELPKVFAKYTQHVENHPEFDSMGIKIAGNELHIEYTIDTNASDFKEMLKYLLNDQNNRDKEILGDIVVLYYNKSGAVYYKRRYKNVKILNNNKYDFLDFLDYSAESISTMLINFSYEKIEHEI